MAPLLVIWEEGLLPELGRHGRSLLATWGFWWQVRFPMRLKAFGLGGFRRALPGVESLVPGQRGPVAEGLAALRALTGLLADVDPAVLTGVDLPTRRTGRAAGRCGWPSLEQERHLPGAAPALAQRCGFSPAWICKW